MSGQHFTLAELKDRLLNGQARRRFVIPNVLPVGVTFLYGTSGTGKSGLAIQIAATIAAGLEWVGRSVQQGAVLYVGAEDFNGLCERLVACAEYLDLELEGVPLELSEAPNGGLISPQFVSNVKATADSVVAKFKQPIGLIVIDTFGASFGDDSQDDARPATKATGALEALAKATDAAVLVVHHEGKSRGSMRGSQVFFDRSDAVIKLTQSPAGPVFCEVEKQRSAPSGARFAFNVESTEVATSGGPISVQVVTQLRSLNEKLSATQSADKRLTDWEQVAVIARKMSLVSAISRENLKNCCFELWSDRRATAKSSAFSTSMRKLLRDGYIKEKGGFVSVSVSKYSEIELLTKTIHGAELSASASAPPPFKGRGAADNDGSSDNADDVPYVHRRRTGTHG